MFFLMGTRFAASAESLGDESMKERLVAAGGDETKQTRGFDALRNAPWPSHYPGRASGMPSRLDGKRARVA